ncbi:MAG: glycosyltransferase family 2 protein [Thermales bacterium]|nr:glycosyltransferase family 2 protein [Thermales bacterium]
MTKDKKPFFSIIIPIYKTEEFLEECLESVKNQTFSDYECIVINDGSPGIPISSKKSPLYKIDSSKQVKKIFDSVTKKDKRFKLYQKKNEGLSATKNFGIAKASGQRLVILDSDDYLNKSYLHNAYSFIIKNNHNNIFYGNVKILEGKKVNSFASSQKFLPTKNSLKTILTFPTWTVTPVSYFWRLDIIQKHQITNRVGKKVKIPHLHWIVC